MRVLHVQKVKGLGGSERHLLSLLPALSQIGLQPRMCALVEGHADRFTNAMRAAGVETVALPAGPDVNPALVLRLLRQVRGFEPDLVHTHLFHGDFYGLLSARLCERPTVSSVHSVHQRYLRHPYWDIGVAGGRLARRTIAISDYVRSFLIDSGLRPGRRIRVVSYGIDASDWTISATKRAHARSDLGLGGNEVAIGIASRLIPGKGHRALLRAVATALPQLPSLRLLIAGDGPLRSELEAACRELPDGTARILGFVSDVRSFMAACDIVAFPTQPELGEGFGLAALEAMAAGRPVVATDVASLPEVVAHEDTGLVVPPADDAQLSKALVKLASDASLRAEMGRRARRRAVERFGLDRMVEETMNVYGEVTSS